ncbi:dolichyl-phosphate-mannose-protein mannosyltransferase family protein [Xenorhabdus miraniensis]|uniref:Dolichyl-phosphate-mannose-protein mannosyltransferase family protein n=2 Tax=Xenorhabdus miraniensis TaxID=351674 RepID=A0A2D0JR19_9GAMM|nr:hypothetical protein [Xenorhabdus miraniensis]PHM48623.1 dolichyl-phosphate-mannose-protein mannosyltransferase family protein [Xenorhabdus miraniensis]PHM48956.1 dolichyl-phosphate-mannose-protein mannosyltransferase family protein [Xenorhabdus miraniensis]
MNKPNKLTQTDIKALLLFLAFTLLYLLPGIYGHTPWKQDENYSFGIIQTMYETGNWLVPKNAGQPFMEKPPLYYWTATSFIHLLSSWLPMYDAARTATLFFSIINFSFFILLSRRVFDARHFTDSRIWIAFALYVSAPGLVRHSHDMFTDTSLIAGTTIGLYGLLGLIKQEKTSYSCLWLIIGTVMTLLSKGVFIPGLLWICLLLAPVFLKQCRTKQYGLNTFLSGVIALVFILPWPVMLLIEHPDLFKVWFWDNNIGRFLGFSVEDLGARGNLTMIPEAVLLFALPSGVLAFIFILMNPIKSLSDEHYFLCSAFVVLGVVLLQISASGRALYLLPFIAPMAILATETFIKIPQIIYKYLTLFSSILWSVLIIFLWVCYFLALSTDYKHWLTPLGRWLPMSYQIHFSGFIFTIAVLITAIWVAKNWLISKSPALHAAQNWVLGIATVWGLVFTLFVGWIDYTKGYQGTFLDLKEKLAGVYRYNDCMASYNIGESEAPMLYYYAHILHQQQKTFDAPKKCDWLLVLFLSEEIDPAPKGMVLFWQGHRPGQDRENLVVYKKVGLEDNK